MSAPEKSVDRSARVIGVELVLQPVVVHRPNQLGGVYGDATPSVVIVGDPARILRGLHLAPSAAPPPPFLAQSLGMLCPFDRRLELSSADGAAVRLAAEVEVASSAAVEEAIKSIKSAIGASHGTCAS